MFMLRRWDFRVTLAFARAPCPGQQKKLSPLFLAFSFALRACFTTARSRLTNRKAKTSHAGGLHFSAQEVGLEPTTNALTAHCSTTELLLNML